VACSVIELLLCGTLTGILNGRAERVLYPGRVTAARQQQMLDELLDSLRRRLA